jgi:predicted site-specific integrase-resolvase
VARLRAWAGGELSVITDVASGLSERRAGLRKVLGQGLVKTKRLRVVVIAETAGGGP